MSIFTICLQLVITVMLGQPVTADVEDVESSKYQQHLGESKVEVIEQHEIQKRRTTNGKGNPSFQSYRLKKESKTEFVSLRCGIGAHWEKSTKKCVPHQPSSEEKQEENVSKDENTDVPMSTKEEKSDVPEPTKEDKSDVHVPTKEDKSNAPKKSIPKEELITGHIVSVHCGVGYSYNKEDHKCTPLSK